MSKYHIVEAFDFYRHHILNLELQALLTAHNLTVAGVVPSRLWELFGSILTGDRAKGGYGSDLEHYEIKSSIDGGSFEYQYHLNGGKQKLLDDMVVDHLFISYSADYSTIEVRFIEGVKLKPIFKSWMPGLVKNYSGKNRKQRYRKSVAYGVVKKEGRLILRIEGGKLVPKTA